MGDNGAAWARSGETGGARFEAVSWEGPAWRAKGRVRGMALESPGPGASLGFPQEQRGAVSEADGHPDAGEKGMARNGRHGVGGPAGGRFVFPATERQVGARDIIRNPGSGGWPIVQGRWPAGRDASIARCPPGLGRRLGFRKLAFPNQPDPQPAHRKCTWRQSNTACRRRKTASRPKPHQRHERRPSSAPSAMNIGNTQEA